jgi:dihydroflavonol-4-reductase
MTAQKQKKVLVTGATGFVGSYLLRYLVEQGYSNIRAGRRPDSPMDLVATVKDKVEWVELDILDMAQMEDAMQGVELIFHCAAVVSFDSRDSALLYKVNKKGTENLVNMALESGVEKLLHISSVATLGRDPKGKLIHERTKWERADMQTDYAKSKYLAEMEAWRGWAEGLEVVVVNPSTILGSGRWDTGTSIFFRLAWNEFSWFAGGSAGFVDVRDVARLSIRAMEEGTSGERFVLCAENWSYKKLMDHIASALGRSKATRQMQDWMKGLVWRWEWFVAWLHGSRPAITRELTQKVTMEYAYDNAKSVEFFNYTYLPVKDTIQSVASQFKAAAKNEFSPAVMPLI